jgi:hypothetical protein
MTLVRIVTGWLLAPRQLLALAGLCAAGGLLWGYATIHENADRQLALRQGPPPTVAIEAYRGVVHRGPAGEVVLRAATDRADPLVLTVPRTGERALAIPLYPLGGGDSALGAVLLPLEAGQTAGDLGPLVAQISDGVVEVNGRIVDHGRFDLILAGALAVEGRAIGDRFVAVRPYVEGREAALQPIAAPARHWLWPLAAALALAVAATYRRFWSGIRLPRRAGPPSREAPRPAATAAVSATGAKSAHFAPLKRQEDVTATEDAPAGGLLAALAVAAGLAGRALRGLFRLAGASLRGLRDGVGEIRSPR